MTDAGSAGPPRFELGTDGPSLIVVGVDGSDASWRALDYAVGVARRQAARILAVYVTPVPTLAFGAMNAALVPPPSDPASPELRRLAETIAGAGRDHGVDVTVCSGHGDPATVISEAAHRHRADLIIVGASHHLGHRYFGSIGRRIVALGQHPVTIVP